MQPRIPMFLSSVAVGIVIAVGALSLIGSEAKARMRPVTASGNSAGAVMSVTAPTNSELTVAYNQLLTNPSQDAKKRPRIVHEIRAMLKRGAIRSGADFYHAAYIASKERTVETTLFAHDLCLASMAMGESRACALAAATQDQFLSLIGRKQRFGTQVAPSKGLVAVESSVTDGMRQILGLPALATARRFAESGKSPLSFKNTYELSAPMMVAVD